jgi:ABC-2 type transport system permease protein
VLKRRRAAPVPASVLIAGRALAAIAVSLAAVGAVCALGRLASGVEPPLDAVPGLLVTVVMGSITFACLAYAVSSAIRSADAAQPAVQAITLPLCVVSGIFIPDAGLPTWLSELGALLPLEPLADGLRHSFDPGTHGVAIAWRDLALLAFWATAGFTLAVRRFNWTPTAADT